jgi:transposase
MPRSPLGPISANIPRGKELTPHTRAKVTTLREEGISIREIAERTKISENTVKWTLKSEPRRNAGITPKRTGRPRSYTERDQRSILRFVQNNPKSTYVDIRQNLHIDLSHDTFQRILNSVGIKNWRAKGRPALEPQDAKVRYTWAMDHYQWTTQWELIIFSDECSVKRGKGA